MGWRVDEGLLVMKIGFIGLGRMGHHVASNLLKAGHQVMVWNRSQSPVQALVHARYRRRVVFMPGFKRAKSGSSLIQTSNHRGRELSTIEQAAREAKPSSSAVGSQQG